MRLAVVLANTIVIGAVALTFGIFVGALIEAYRDLARSRQRRRNATRILRPGFGKDAA